MVPPETATTTVTLSTTTTTSASVASRAEMLIFGPSGLTFSADTPAGEWLWGDVSEEATVTINGAPTKVTHVGQTSFGPDWWRWNDAEADGGIVVPLDIGRNTIEVTATFTDGSSVTRYVHRHHDPTLVAEEGYIMRVESGNPPTATLELTEFILDEWGVTDPKTRSDIVEMPITDDAVFVVLPMQETWGKSMSLTDMLDLQELNSRGPLEGFWWDIIFPPYAEDGWHKAAPWQFLITEDGYLQQATQLYSP